MKKKSKRNFSEEQKFFLRIFTEFYLWKLRTNKGNQPLFIVEEFRQLEWLFDLNLEHKSVGKNQKKTYTTVL